MEDAREGTPKRRTLLQRGAALLGGALGLGGTASAVASASGPEPSALTGRTLNLRGRRRPQVAARGQRPAAITPGTASGEIFDDDGRTIGSFHAHAFAQPSPLAGLPAAYPLELQTFVLPGGTLFGLGVAPGRDGERTCAVLGGTGDFAGAQGSYVERPAPSAQTPAGTVDFVIRLSA